MTNLEFDPDGNDSYDLLMRQADTMVSVYVEKIARGWGGATITLVSSDRDRQEEAMLVDKFASGVGVLNPHHIDVGQVASSIELRIDVDRLGIPERDLRRQSLAENFYQYIFQGFGQENGLRVGRAASYDRSQKSLSKARLALSPIGDFVKTLDINLPHGEEKERQLVVLHFPDLDAILEQAGSAKLESLSPEKARTVSRAIALYEITTLAGYDIYNNPRGDSVINIIDGAYRWFAARNIPTSRVSEYLADGIDLPGAREIDRRVAAST